MENPNMTYYGVCSDCPDIQLRKLKWLFANDDSENILIIHAANVVDDNVKSNPCMGRENPEQECQLPVRDFVTHVMVGALVLKDC